MRTTITFRAWNSPAVAAPPAGDAIFLMRADYTTAAAAARQITVDGVSFGSLNVAVSITVGSAPAVLLNAAVGVNGRFSVQLAVPQGGPTDSVVVSGSNTDAGCVGTDTVVFLFRDAGVVALNTGVLALLAADQLRYAAGAPDRLQYSKTFVKLDPRPSWLLRGGNILVGNDKFGYMLIDADDFNKEMEALMKPLLEEMKEGKKSMVDHQAFYERSAIEVLKKVGKGADPGTLATMKKAGAKPSDKKKGGTRAFAYNGKKGSPGVLYIPPSRWYDEESITNELKELIKTMIAYHKAHRRLGVLFHERLRTRPTNEVFGEPFYQLGLTPGEEVQVRQTTETKRRTAFTEINDREDERTNSFSSNWSTDMASTISSQNNFQMGTNIGGGAEASIPDVPVGVNAQAGASTSEAHGISTQETTQTRRELTEAATARFRQQHRTQIELAVEDNQSFGSTRTLRNQDQQRNQMHTFFKVYRKDQMTLERYDSRLCFRFVVHDPAQATRALFMAGLNKIDPEVLAYRNVAKPADHLVNDFDITFNAPDTPIPAVHGWREDRILTVNEGLYRHFDIPSDRYDLDAMPRWTMTKCCIADHSGMEYTGPDDGTDPCAVGEAKRSYIEYIEEAWAFRRNGGTIDWDVKPDPTRDKTAWAWTINMPRNFDGPQLGDNRTTEVNKITFNVECRWRLNSAGMSDYLTKVENERLRLSADFNAQMIYDLHALASSDYPSAVVDLAMSQNLRSYRHEDLFLVKELFEMEGITIDNVPYWADPTMKRQYELLAARLERLPVSIEQHRVLTDQVLASQAVVYVPIRKGKEREALDMLKEARPFAEMIAQDVEQFRDARYGRLKNFVAPGLDVHMGPRPVTGTPPGSADWVNDWERPQNKFDILGQWAELIPTDGVHVETQLSTTTVTDEHETDRLHRIQIAGT